MIGYDDIAAAAAAECEGPQDPDEALRELGVDPEGLLTYIRNVVMPGEVLVRALFGDDPLERAGSIFTTGFAMGLQVARAQAWKASKQKGGE